MRFLLLFMASLTLATQSFASAIPASCSPYNANNAPGISASVTLRPTQLSCSSKYDSRLAPVNGIREVTINGEEFILTVNSNGFTTDLVRASCLECTTGLSDGSYKRTVEQTAEAPFPLQNDGITHALNRHAGFVVTVDLCPSEKPLVRETFLAMIEHSPTHPAPVAVSVSGLWMDHHRSDLEFLLDLQAKGKLAITWVNHSSTHPYKEGLPLTSNFLLSHGVNFDDEVFKLEARLIRRGLNPSPFFRFPGLVSSQTLVKRLASFGLMPLGADAWLAKGQHAEPGSIILIHANGNEPTGIHLFLRLLGSLSPAAFFSSLEETLSER